MLDNVYAQLKRFREEDEARWRYEAEEVKRQNRIFAEHGRTEAQAKAALEKAGINVRALEEESAEAVRRLEASHKQLLTVGPPPARSGRKQPVLLNYLSSLGQHIPWPLYRCDWFYPPLHDAWGSGEEVALTLTWRDQYRRTLHG